MRLFVLLMILYIFPATAIENDPADPKAESGLQAEQAFQERSSIVLPHKGDGWLVLPQDTGPCTRELEGAIQYNSAKKLPETCTKNGWRAWGEKYK